MVRAYVQEQIKQQYVCMYGHDPVRSYYPSFSFPSPFGVACSPVVGCQDISEAFKTDMRTAGVTLTTTTEVFPAIAAVSSTASSEPNKTASSSSANAAPLAGSPTAKNTSSSSGDGTSGQPKPSGAKFTISRTDPKTGEAVQAEVTAADLKAIFSS
jgi:hypothetical protein